MKVGDTFNNHRSDLLSKDFIPLNLFLLVYLIKQLFVVTDVSLKPSDLGS